MKEFTTAVADILDEDEREDKIKALMEEKDGEPGLSRQDAEDQVDDDIPVKFSLDGRTMHAYMPTDGQLAFMMAAMGRGQSDNNRFAAIVNIMLESLRDADRQYMEERLLTRDKTKRLPVKQVEAIFEHLSEEWFARPTK